ncbi:MAG: dihydrolipoyl dehydrogenase [Opitutaceae bacterium]|jgi:dihydrolipoamide dehydrogenase
MNSFDLIVIGGGPGGYVCAFRAAQLGMKVALVEKRPALGGTCLNIGCIPSKALLHSTEQLVFARKHAAEHGIRLGSVDVDLAALMRRKEGVVAKLTGGIAQLAKARKVTVFTGTATFTSPTDISVALLPDPKSQEPTTSSVAELTAKVIVIATGSSVVELPAMKFDGKMVISSEQALSLDSIPKRMVVVGGGAIGLELGSVWNRLGSQVTVVEFLPKIAANYDDDVTRAFTRILEKQGIRIITGAKVTSLKASGASLVLCAEQTGKALDVETDTVLVAVGRRPFTEGLGLEKAGVALDEKKRIAVDDHLRTNVPGIWAIGDVIAGPMLAHKAEEDGVAVAEWIAGKAGHVNWDLMPGIIYTDPELAGVGLGEEAAKAKGRAVKVGKFNFAANGRAIASDATDGFVKIIADAKTDRILGAQILGRGAGELISEVVTHMEYGGSAEDLARTVHAHPTLGEAVKEAALAVSKSALHGL